MYSSSETVTVQLSSFERVSIRMVSDFISSSTPKTCDLDPIPTRLLKECTDLITSVISNMINLSLSTGTIPSSWKEAIILPSLKSGKKDLVKKNYRPISNLSFASKICEKAVAMQFNDHLVKNNLMEPFQSAYRPNHSTKTALVRVCNDNLHAIDQRKITIFVLLDLSAAFDTVDHQILLDQLHIRFGVCGVALDWFKCYLTGRRQFVSVNGMRSDPKLLKCGVPQGSVLGPLLFLAYLSPLGDIIRKHGLYFHSFADDTKLYLAFDANSTDNLSDALRSTQLAILDIKNWLSHNLLKFNIGKIELLLIGSCHQFSKLCLPITI